ncbi:MAG: hypothetical protein HC808_04725, partial [Candidatus Competibacteraceae bacterium]|nr:hypothetical protein [Candidatus Competibacteraceae bacterium]
MLQSIRDRAQGLVAGVIVVAICLTFAFWGVGEYLNAASKVVVAEVNGEEIELGEYQQHLVDARNRAQAEQGAAFNPDDWSREETRLLALQSLIDKKLLLQAGIDAGVRVSDIQLAESIQSMPEFRDPATGRFSNENYQRFLMVTGRTSRAFETEFRDDLVAGQLRYGISTSAFITDDEVMRVARLLRQRRDIAYAIIDGERHNDGIVLDEQEIATWFDTHKADYFQPERFRLAYLEL